MKIQGIVMSGLPGSGKSVLCTELKKEYGWQIDSIGNIWRTNWKAKYPNGEVTFENYWRSTSDDDNLKVNIAMEERMRKENLIVDSRYTAFYSMNLPYLRVFLTAGLEIRAHRGIGKYKDKNNNELGVSEIGPILRDREQDEVKRGIDLFGKDYRNPHLYQLILDSGIMSINEEFEAVKKEISKLG